MKLIQSIKKRAKFPFEISLSLIHIIQIIAWRLMGARLLVINEAGGLGDYLWVRSYLKLIREQTDYKIIFCVTERWKSFARVHDGKNIDILVSLKKPNKPHTFEKIIFNFFVAEVFIDIRVSSPVRKCIRYKEKIESLDGFGTTYDTRGDLFKKIINIPKEFTHSIDCVPIKNPILLKPYCILVPAGHFQGSFSEEQLLAIAKKLISHGVFVLILGINRDKDKYSFVYKGLNETEKNKLIDGCDVYKDFELPTIINNALFIVTPNTSIYNMAIQLRKHIIVVDRKIFERATRYHDEASICLRPLENDLSSLAAFPIVQIEEAIDKKFALCDEDLVFHDSK